MLAIQFSYIFEMPWSMSDNLKIQKFKIIITENICQKLKFLLLLLNHLWKTSGRQFRSFFMHYKCKNVQPLVLWVSKVFATCVRLQTQPKIFEKINLETKNNFLVYGENTYYTISIYGKMFIIKFSYNFLYVWHCMKLYEKKFPINENCMISLFGQPELLVNTAAIDCALTE